jgi:hypothetical protein
MPATIPDGVEPKPSTALDVEVPAATVPVGVAVALIAPE